LLSFFVLVLWLAPHAAWALNCTFTATISENSGANVLWFGGSQSGLDADACLNFGLIATTSGSSALGSWTSTPAGRGSSGTQNPDNQITYTPAAGAVGTDSFSIAASDLAPNDSTLAVTIIIAAVPTPQPSSATVAANSTNNAIPLTITGGTATSLAISAPAGHGTATVIGTTIAYTPTGGYSGADSFQYTATNSAGGSLPATVTITVTPPPSPSVSSLSLTGGPTAGGTSVVIAGTNLTGATAVQFGAASAVSFTVNGATQITATAPAGSGAVDVTVTTAGGTSATGANDRYTYFATPTVSSISPARGPAAGGTSVVITGTNLTSATAVKFGGTNATTFAVNSATQVTATAPSGTGVVDVTVTTPGGTSATGLGDQYSYIATPTVSSLGPASGPAAGGTSVIITGTNLTGATSVKFGATSATTFTVNGATQITATAPAGSSVVDVTVTTAGGTSATSAGDQYTYAGTPSVTSIGPTSGPAAGGTSVVITGTNLSGATAVKFGATNATTFTINSATQITATAPVGSGVVAVTVTTAGGTSATGAGDQYTYAGAPTVSSLSPTSGPTGGGTSVIITGTNLTGANSVKFGAANATSYVVNSATQITAVSPANAAGAVSVVVTTPGGTNSATFTYVNALVLTSTPSATTQVGQLYSQTNAASGGTSPFVYSVSAGAIPSGTTLNTGTGLVSGTLTSAGNFNYTIKVTDSSPTPQMTTQVVSGAISGGISATSIASSLNPSNAGQAVTFTASVTGSGGPPTGTVTFKDGGTVIGTAALAGGVATLTTTALSVGSHTISASYGGSAVFGASASPALQQAVNVPADSIKLRQLQVAVTKVVAQNSGQAISGALDNAIADGFSDGGSLVTPDGAGLRFNFSADPDQPGASSAARSEKVVSDRWNGMFGRDSTSSTDARGYARNQQNTSRVDDAFAAINRNAMATKAPPPIGREPKEWLLWADVRGSGIDRWGSTMGTASSLLYGSQVNALMGLTRKLTSNFLIGVVSGYETFDYTSQDLNGKLKGNGWTVGSYLGWKLSSAIRFDAAVAYSGIGYDGTAGTAQGNFDGRRWMVSSGLTGNYRAYGFDIEPSAKIYALWEHEKAYTDSLGTPQADRDFATGRASAGMKLAYPFAWTDAVALAPYAGLYGDYYFTHDDAAAIAAAGATPLASTPLLDGWSARGTAGLAARFASGAVIAVGGELGGIGSSTRIWTYRARAAVPF
jgi:hypothetical protein